MRRSELRLGLGLGLRWICASPHRPATSIIPPPYYPTTPHRFACFAGAKDVVVLCRVGGEVVQPTWQTCISAMNRYRTKNTRQIKQLLRRAIKVA